MRICSLLPSGTEIVAALGLVDTLVGVTYECDFPPAVKEKPIVVNTRLPAAADPGEIDKLVREYLSRGESLYKVESDVLRKGEPDLVVTQELCNVCAATPGDLASALRGLAVQPRVLSLHPHRIEEVWNDILAVGEATERQDAASELVDGLCARIEAVGALVSKADAHPRVVCLEWTDPPMVAGHWVPEMVALAGGVDVLGSPEKPSFRIDWGALLDAKPDVVVVMPCGYGSDQAASEWRSGSVPRGLNARIFAVDANSYFSRPGPRLATGVELLAHLLHPKRAPAVGNFVDLS